MSSSQQILFFYYVCSNFSFVNHLYKLNVLELFVQHALKNNYFKYFLTMQEEFADGDLFDAVLARGNERDRNRQSSESNQNGTAPVRSKSRSSSSGPDERGNFQTSVNSNAATRAQLYIGNLTWVSV